VTDHRLGKKHFSWEDIMERDGLPDILGELKIKHDADLLEERLEVATT
jgi:protein subunit release factor A